MDRAALDAAYNNQAAVPDFAGWVRIKRALSQQLAPGARIDLKYGERDRNRLDFFPADRADAPLLVFVHGGYWQGGSKDSTGFVALGALAHHFAVAVIEYTIAPQGSLDQMAAEVIAALAWLRTHADELGVDPARIVLAGHSAGAQLLCLALGEPGVLGGIALSGIYDLEPIRLSYLNEALQLEAEDVLRLSPMQRGIPAGTPLMVAVGADELPELVRQSADFAALMRSRGCAVQYLPLSGHDHFSVLDELADVNGHLCRHLREYNDTKDTAE
jgi:acetyl esterase/lipase